MLLSLTKFSVLRAKCNQFVLKLESVIGSYQLIFVSCQRQSLIENPLVRQL